MKVRALWSVAALRAESSLFRLFIAGNAAVNNGGGAWTNDTFWTLPNPLFWQDVDRRVAAVNRAGLVASLAVGIGRR